MSKLVRKAVTRQGPLLAATSHRKLPRDAPLPATLLTLVSRARLNEGAIRVQSADLALTPTVGRSARRQQRCRAGSGKQRAGRIEQARFEKRHASAHPQDAAF